MSRLLFAIIFALALCGAARAQAQNPPSALPSGTPAATDVVPYVDMTASPKVLKKSTVSDFLSNLTPSFVQSANKQGNGSKFQIFGGGSVSTNDCAKFDSGGNIVSNGAGCGTVTSVGLSTPGVFYNVTSSPVAGAGTLTLNLISQVANCVFAGPTSGASASPTCRALVGADLPTPSSSTLGGVKSLAAVSHKFLTQIGTDGAPAQAQPAQADINGLGTGDAVQFLRLGLNQAADASVPLAMTGAANNITLLQLKRNTDTSPTGAFTDFQNAAGSSLWKVDITGSLAAGIVPVARVSGLAAVATSGSATDLAAGTLPAGRMPALTGDCTTSAGAVATTCTGINGVNLTAAYTTYTPTVTCGSGSITTLGAVTGRYRQIGKTVFVQLSIAITTNGTCATDVRVSLPVAVSAFDYTLSGTAFSNGKLLRGYLGASATTIRITYYDATHPGADGQTLVLSGSYESN